MKLTANITLDELTKSQVAERKGINNNPNPQQIENLKALVEKLEIAERVEFVGWLNKNENYAYYNGGKVFISIPRSDATGISLMEAMSGGCLPVVSNLPA